MAFARVCELYDLPTLHDQPDNQIELVQLVYSLNTDGNQRTLSLKQKLAMLGLPLKTPPLPVFSENEILPSVYFILGLFLGEGSLGVTLD